jgi:hypothetical protein
MYPFTVHIRRATHSLDQGGIKSNCGGSDVAGILVTVVEQDRKLCVTVAEASDDGNDTNANVRRHCALVKLNPESVTIQKVHTRHLSRI